MSCPVCHKHHLVEIDVTVGEHRITMHSCSGCTARWWDREGERWVLAADRLSANRPASWALSSIFAIQYWQGVSDEMGGRARVLAAIMEHAPGAPSEPICVASP